MLYKSRVKIREQKAQLNCECLNFTLRLQKTYKILHVNSNIMVTINGTQSDKIK